MDKFMENLTDLPKYFWVLMGGLVSLTAYILIEKFKNRLSIFSSKITFSPIGTSYDDKIFGQITVKHQDREIKHLNFITITIKNISNSDFEDLVMKVWVDKSSQILAEKGNYADNLSSIFLTNEYSQLHNNLNERAEKFRAENPDAEFPEYLMNQYDVFAKNREYNIPVLNRGSSFYINLLVENFDGKVPICQYSLLHKGVKVITEVDEKTKNDELGKGMLIWGYIILTIYSIFLLRQDSFNFRDVLIFVIFSFIYLWLGLGIHYLIKYIKSIFR